MPYKEREKLGTPRKRDKPRYVVTNWSAYNQSLRKRGMITLDFPKGDLVAQFYNEHSYAKGVSGRLCSGGLCSGGLCSGGGSGMPVAFQRSSPL